MRKLALLLLLTLLFPLCSATIYINELMPNPIDDCLDCTEWVELYNDGNEDVDVGNYALNDSTDHYIYIKLASTDSNTIIKANDFLVIYNFSYGFKLRNSEDTIRLFDKDESEIDSVSYSNFNTKASYDKTWSRRPDGGEFWEKIEPTRGESNGEEDPPEEDNNVEETTTNNDETADNNEQASDSTNQDEEGPKEEQVIEEPEEEEEQKITGKTVYVSTQKKSLTKPLLLLLLGLLVVVVVLQMQLVSNK